MSAVGWYRVTATVRRHRVAAVGGRRVAACRFIVGRETTALNYVSRRCFDGKALGREENNARRSQNIGFDQELCPIARAISVE